MAEERRLRRSKALAASALLHLAALALLFRALPARPPSAERAPPPAPAIELSLAEPAPEALARPAPPVITPAPARRPKLGAVPERAAPARPERAASEPPGAASPEAGAAAGPKRTPPVAPPVDLSFDALRDGAKQRATASPNSEEGGEAPAPPPPVRGSLSVGELRSDVERGAAAAENVRGGRAHPLLFDYLRGARDRMLPEATRIAEGLPLGPAQSAKGWGRGYLGRVAAVNRHAATDLPEEPDPSVGGRRPDVLGGYNEAERQAASGAEQRTAEVCLGVAPGHAVSVTLRRSSGNAALDRVALASFESAGQARPVAADIKPNLACYLVRVSAFRMPPLPSLSLGWKNGHPDVIYPLKRITKVTVALQSVDFGPARGPSSLLERPR